MRRYQQKFGAVLCGAALFLAVGPAFASPTAPVSLLPALDVFVDTLAAGHNAALACSAVWPPMKTTEAEWTKARAIFIATLWANDFPIDFVRTATQRLDAAPATKPDCTQVNSALAAELGLPSAVGWLEVIQDALEGMDLTVVTNPIPPATWTTIKDTIAKALPDERRLLDCVAVRYPQTLPTMVHDWDAMIVKIGGSLAGTGLPRDEVGAALDGAEANQLWHRAAPDTEAELRDSCIKDQAMAANLANFGFRALGTAIDKLLPPASSASGSN